MFANGMYRPRDLSDFGSLYGCGCETGQATQQSLLSGIPNWFLIGALVVGGLIAMKKGR